MPMTNSESQWLARAFRTIAQIALIEPSNAVDSAANKDPGEQALHATRTLIQLNCRSHRQTDRLTQAPSDRPPEF
jgi:hypothetical protein